MTLTVDKYPNSLQILTRHFAQAAQAFPGTRLTVLAQDLIEGAKHLDMEKARHMGVTGKYSEHGIVRDPANPPEFDHPDIIGVPEADDPLHPLPPGEQWNEDRRATQTGAVYGTDEKGRPVCPYMNYGIKGRGLLWLYGPNHAIDNGVLEITPDENGIPALYIVGITRKDDRLKRPALSGGFAKFKKTADGKFVFDEEAILETRLEEFFEEMVSDSVGLLPEYAARIEEEFAKATGRITSRRDAALSEAHAEEIREQVVTALKLEQVRDLDPGFLDRLREFLRQGTECFAGPVLSSGRAAINAWIESRMNWVLLDDENWARIADNGPFAYRLSGGDDSGGVYRYRVCPETIATAIASHGAMMGFMLASFLLDSQQRGRVLHPAIMRQIEDVADFLRAPLPAAIFEPPGPAPA